MMNTDRKGSITVEMAYIMPLVLMVFFLSIMGIFFYHDKNIIAGCAYETAVIGSTKAREKEGVTSELLKTVFAERIQKKCILFGSVESSITVSKAEVTVVATAQKNSMKISVTQRASITEPEEYIRNIRRIK